MKTTLKNTRSYLVGGLAMGLIAAVMLIAGTSKADAESNRSVVTEISADEVAADVDYRAPGVSFKQFGSAAQQLAEQANVAGAGCAQWRFTRAFAWAAYEYTYNRPNYDRWVAQLDARLQDVMQGDVAEYVAAGRPPLGNPLHAAAHAHASWVAYAQASVVAAK